MQHLPANQKLSITLFVKAANFASSAALGSRRCAGCLRSHKWLLVFQCLQQTLTSSFCQLHVEYVQLDNPMEKYVKLHAGRRLPVCQVQSSHSPTLVADTEENLELLLQRIAPTKFWTLSDDILHVVTSLYPNFKKSLLNQSRRHLKQNLEAVQQLLLTRQSRFLTSECSPAYADCDLMVKLHHVFVCSQYLPVVVRIEHTLLYIWRYLDSMYHWPVFTQWCPLDREILQQLTHFVQPWPKEWILPSLMEEQVTLSVTWQHSTGLYDDTVRCKDNAEHHHHNSEGDTTDSDETLSISDSDSEHS